MQSVSDLGVSVSHATSLPRPITLRTFLRLLLSFDLHAGIFATSSLASMKLNDFAAQLAMLGGHAADRDG